MSLDEFTALVYGLGFFALLVTGIVLWATRR